MFFFVPVSATAGPTSAPILAAEFKGYGGPESQTTALFKKDTKYEHKLLK